jgi:hypothetical protein
MKNVNISVEGSLLHITVDLTKNCGRSKSGKTTIIATTEGCIRPIPTMAEIQVGLNVFK